MTEDYNDDFNPDLNYDDAEALQHAKRTQKALQHLHQKQMKEYNDKMLDQLWVESLKEEGIDPETYAMLSSQDPELTKDLLKAGMRNVVRGVKQGRQRDPKTGRFVSSQPQPSQGRIPHDEARAKSEVMERMKVKSEKEHLSDDDMMEVLDSLFPGGL